MSPLLDRDEMVAFHTLTFPQLCPLDYGWNYWTRRDGERVDMTLTVDDTLHLECWKEVCDIMQPVTGDRALQKTESQRIRNGLGVMALKLLYYLCSGACRRACVGCVGFPIIR
jgi:hypothetical protein